MNAEVVGSSPLRERLLGRRATMIAAVAAMVLWLVVEVILVSHHEPWRDEADAWLVARTVSVRELFHLTRYMGTPALWYLVQMPFARLGLPYQAQAWLNLAFAAAAVALFLFRAPFPWPLRVLLVFSYFLGYELPVVARPYALSVLLLFAVAALDHARRTRPLLYGLALAALPSTTVFTLAFSAALSGLWALECWTERAPWSRWTGVAIALAGQVGAALQIVPSPMDGQKPPGLTWQVKPFISDYALRQAFFPMSTSGITRIVVALVLLAVVVKLWPERRILVAWIVGSAYLIAVYSFVYASGVRHFSYLLWLVLVSLWMRLTTANVAADVAAPVPTPRDPRWRRRLVVVLPWALACALAYSVGQTAWFGAHEVVYEFSDAALMARYLKDNGLAGRMIAAHAPAAGSAVLPYFPGKTFWYPGLRAWGTHMKWDRTYRIGSEKSTEEIVRDLQQDFPNWANPRDGVLLLLNDPLANADRYGYQLVHATPHRASSTGFGARNEQFFLYAPAPRAVPP